MSDKTAIQPDSAWLDGVDDRSGEKVGRCYQCRKCTNGCPLTFAMDLMPNQVMRAIQLGLSDEVLRSKTVWVCASCQTCSTRCPNDIDIAHVMDVLRQMGREGDVPPGDENIMKFHEAVLRSVRRHGRMFELGMVGGYKFATRSFMDDMGLGWSMFTKGKLKFLPEGIKAKDEVRRMFDKDTKEGEG